MPDYKERFEKWQRETKEKFEEIDKQIGLKEKLGESARAVAETAQKSAEKIKSEAEKSEIGKQAVKAAGETIKTATEAGKKAWDASEPIRDAAAEAGKKAGEVLGDVRDSAGKNADRVSRVFNFGAGWTRSFDAALKSVRKASGWIAEKPLEAATTGVSMAVGAGLGVAADVEGTCLIHSNRAKRNTGWLRRPGGGLRQWGRALWCNCRARLSIRRRLQEHWYGML